MPSSATIAVSVLPVSAEIGLKERLPHSLTQISLRMSSRTGACRPAATISSASRVTRSLFSPDGSPSEKRRPSTWRIEAGRVDLDGGIDDRADDALGPEPLQIAPPGSTASRRVPSSGSAEPVEIPPGHAVLHGDDGGVGAEQRCDLGERRTDRMGLQRQHDIVLHAEVGCPLGGAHGDRRLLAVLDEAQAVRLDRLEMRAARDDRQVDAAGGRQLGGEIAADRAGAEDA